MHENGQEVLESNHEVLHVMHALENQGNQPKIAERELMIIYNKAKYPC
jgi:hypothetical protein